MNDFGKLVKRMGIQRKYIFLLILRSPFDAFRTWMLAGLMQSVFLCLETKDAGRLLGICIIYGLLCALLYFYNGTIWSIYAAFSAKTEVMLQKKMLEKILSMPLKRVDSKFSGEWITNLNGDIHATIMMMNGPMNMPHMVVAVLNTIVSSFLMLKSSVLMFAITLLFILPHLFINNRIVLKPIARLREKSQMALAESTSAIKPLITEADTILLYDASDLMMKQCEEANRKLMRINMKMHLRNALSDVVMRLFGIGGYFTILMIGYSLIYDGAMAFSDVVYCFQVRGSIMSGIFMLIICMNNIKANSVCIRRINDTFEE